MKTLIEKIEQLIIEEQALNKKIGINPEGSYHYQMLVKLKQLAIAEHERIIKELEATINDAGSIIAVSHAISIVKGE